MNKRRNILRIVIGITLALAVKAGDAPTFTAERVASKTFDSSVYTVHLGERSKPLMILIHGLGEAGWLDWQQVMPKLAQDHFVVTFDLPGFGQSAPSATLYSPENYAALTEEIRRHYVATRSVASKSVASNAAANNPAIILGHSMGGAVALKYAANFPEHIQELILVDVAGVVHRSVFTQYAMKESLRPNDALLNTLFGWIEPGIERLNEGVSKRVELLPDLSRFLLDNASARTYLLADRTNIQAALALIDSNFSEDFAKISAKTKIIWGQEDPVTSVRVAKLLAYELAQNQMHVIDGAAHVPMKSHLENFVHLVRAPFVASPHSYAAKESSVSDEVICRDQKRFRFQGKVKRLQLINCKDAELHHIEAEELVMSHSSANIEYLSMRSNAPAIRINNARVTITGAKIEAPEIFVVENAVLDVAGLSCVGSERIWTGTKGTAFFSVTRRQRGDNTIEQLHGVYTLP